MSDSLRIEPETLLQQQAQGKLPTLNAAAQHNATQRHASPAVELQLSEEAETALTASAEDSPTAPVEAHIEHIRNIAESRVRPYVSASDIDKIVSETGAIDQNKLNEMIRKLQSTRDAISTHIPPIIDFNA